MHTHHNLPYNPKTQQQENQKQKDNKQLEAYLTSDLAREVYKVIESLKISRDPEERRDVGVFYYSVESKAREVQVYPSSLFACYEDVRREKGMKVVVCLSPTNMVEISNKIRDAGYEAIVLSLESETGYEDKQNLKGYYMGHDEVFEIKYLRSEDRWQISKKEELSDDPTYAIY